MAAAEGERPVPIRELFAQSRAALNVSDRREAFEGKEDYETTCVRLRRRLEQRPPIREADRFLQLMRDRGGGNVALAWRRYFDSDGDGNLDFREFCEALIELKYKGDVPALWTELGGALQNSLTLDALDPENAAVLDYFGIWCASTLGGPLEVFKKIDADGSDSLTADEFAEGLRELGFFDRPDRPPGLGSEDEVLSNLFPLLDQNGHGCITPSQLLFLEKDVEKKVVLERQLARIAKHGVEAAPEPLPNDAQRMLHNLAMSTTMFGGKSKALPRGFEEESLQGLRRGIRRGTGGSLKGSASLSSLPLDSRSPSAARSPCQSPGSVGRGGPSPKGGRGTPTLPHIGSESSLPRLTSQESGSGKSRLVPLPAL